MKHSKNYSSTYSLLKDDQNLLSDELYSPESEITDEEIDEALGEIEIDEEYVIEASKDFEEWPLESESDYDLFDIYATKKAEEIE